MHLGTRKQSASDAVPLQGAVLCVNCECVSSGRFDACPVCGSRSLLSIGHMLGGTPLSDQAASTKDHDVVLFDLTITIELKQMDPRDVNAALERITRLIGPRLGQGRACFHIDVEPLAVSRNAEELKAA
jgi:hypothetical protein